ncbi:MAG: endolytic transglycosylase MltG [Roseburia sp.]|nr:endolytic transglycosylase MltG [Roseburia sp.]
MNLNKIVFKFVRFSFSILVMLLVVVCLVKLGTFCYEFGYRVFTEAPMEEAPGTEKNVEITADMSEGDIGKLLEKNGLVRDATLFYAQLKLSAYTGKLRPGTYTLNTSMTAKEMMVIMATVPEGETETETESEAGAEP